MLPEKGFSLIEFEEFTFEVGAIEKTDSFGSNIQWLLFYDFLRLVGGQTAGQQKGDDDGNRLKTWAPMTVNRALKSLQEHGFIERVRKQKVSDQPLPAIIYRFL